MIGGELLAPGDDGRRQRRAVEFRVRFAAETEKRDFDPALGAGFNQIRRQTDAARSDDNLIQIHEGVLLFVPLLIAVAHADALRAFAEGGAEVGDGELVHVLLPP